MQNGKQHIPFRRFPATLKHLRKTSGHRRLNATRSCFENRLDTFIVPLERRVTIPHSFRAEFNNRMVATGSLITCLALTVAYSFCRLASFFVVRQGWQLCDMPVSIIGSVSLHTSSCIFDKRRGLVARQFSDLLVISRLFIDTFRSDGSSWFLCTSL